MFIQYVSCIEKKFWKFKKTGEKDLLQSWEIISDESPHIPFSSKKIYSKTDYVVIQKND